MTTTKKKVKSDIEIAQQSTMQPILDIAKKIGLTENDLELYGKYKGKLSYEAIHKLKDHAYGGVHRRPGQEFLLPGNEYTSSGRAPGHRIDPRYRSG